MWRPAWTPDQPSHLASVKRPSPSLMLGRQWLKDWPAERQAIMTRQSEYTDESRRTCVGVTFCQDGFISYNRMWTRAGVRPTVWGRGEITPPDQW